MPESADTIRKKNKVVDMIKLVHDNSANIFFNNREKHGVNFKENEFYAIHQPTYFDPMEWIDEALIFLSTVESWSKEEDQVEKRRYQHTAIVDGFRLKARTSAFFRERLRTDGHIYYDGKQDETDQIGYQTRRRFDYL